MFLPSLRRRATSRPGVLAGDAGSTCLGPERLRGWNKQDENEPEGEFKVDVVSASFPGRQHLADEANLRIQIRNKDSREIPNLAVTVDGFGKRRDDPTLSDPVRPVWILNEAPQFEFGTHEHVDGGAGAGGRRHAL